MLQEQERHPSSNSYAAAAMRQSEATEEMCWEGTDQHRAGKAAGSPEVSLAACKTGCRAACNGILHCRMADDAGPSQLEAAIAHLAAATVPSAVYKRHFAPHVDAQLT
jgi:hypothetical protein